MRNLPPSMAAPVQWPESSRSIVQSTKRVPNTSGMETLRPVKTPPTARAFEPKRTVNGFAGSATERSRSEKAKYHPWYELPSAGTSSAFE